MIVRSFLRVSAVVGITVTVAAACQDATPTAPMNASVRPSASVAPATVFASGSVPVTAWDPIYPASAYPDWTALCTGTPLVGPGANWLNPHAATAFPSGTHPWEFIPPMDFSASWINAWSDISSRGPNGQSWTKYSTPVSGQGDYVVQFLADNCSWIYLDNTLIGAQTVDWQSGSGRYPLTLAGEHTLTFIILDGGGAAGGKFRLETRESFIDNGGVPSTLPDNTPPEITPQITGTLGKLGWYTSDVAVSWTVTDAQSTVTSSSGCGTSAVINDTNGVTFTCSATSAGGTASQSVTVKRDATIPVVVAALVPTRLRGGDSDDDGDGGRLFLVQASCTNAVITSAAINGVAVTNGQTVQLVQSRGKPQVRPARGKSPLMIKAQAFELVVTCEDEAGNVGRGSAVPDFSRARGGDKDDDDHGDITGSERGRGGRDD